MNEKTASEVEELASKIGWDGSWEGDPEEKVTAEEYILRTQDINKRASKDISNLKQTISNLENQMREVATNTGRQVKQAVDAARQRLKDERNKAIENADTKRVEVLDEELSLLNKHQDSEPVQQQAPPVNRQQEEYMRELDKFTSDNPWFDPKSDQFDQYLRGKAIEIGTVLYNGNPSTEPRELIRAMMSELKKREPERFAQPSNKPTYVSGGRPAARQKETLWGKLLQEEPEAAGVFSDYVKRGVFKDTDEAKENYAKEVLNG